MLPSSIRLGSGVGCCRVSTRRLSFMAGWTRGHCHFPVNPIASVTRLPCLTQGVPAVAVRWALVLEFQAEPESDMLDRLLEYLARVRRELRHGPERRRKYAVIGGLLNLTGPRQ